MEEQISEEELAKKRSLEEVSNIETRPSKKRAISTISPEPDTPGPIMPPPRKVNFLSNNINLVGELYIPPAAAADRRKAGIVISHPMTGIKEQTAGLHARALAEAGFVTLAFDSAFQGESDGEPRFLESPMQRVEDIKAAVSFLSTQADLVDPDRIGALGICAGGGYVPNAAQTDIRIRAVATINAVCTGAMIRTGIPQGIINSELVTQNLMASCKQRTLEFSGKEPLQSLMVTKNPEDIPADAAAWYKDAALYYSNPDNAHVRSTQLFLLRSGELLANYDSWHFNSVIAPRPVLLIAGRNSDTKSFSDEAFKKLAKPKELFLVDGSGHVDLYHDLTQTLPKLVEFFAAHIGAVKILTATDIIKNSNWSSR